VIRPSECDLKYHLRPIVLEYVRKKLYILRFPQLLFVMTSPLINEHFTASINLNSVRMQNPIVVHVCAINFFYVFIVPRPILRHLGEFGKIRLLLGENTRFLPEGGQYGYLEDGLWTIFNFFFFCVD
jgi:hypothetical protein